MAGLPLFLLSNKYLKMWLLSDECSDVFRGASLLDISGKFKNDFSVLY